MSFFGAMMGEIGKNLKAKQARELDENQRALDREYEINSKIIGNPDFSPEAQQAAAEKLDEIIAGGKKSKGKGMIPRFSDIIGNLIHGKKQGQAPTGRDPVTGENTPLANDYQITGGMIPPMPTPPQGSTGPVPMPTISGPNPDPGFTPRIVNPTNPDPGFAPSIPPMPQPPVAQAPVRRGIPMPMTPQEKLDRDIALQGKALEAQRTQKDADYKHLIDVATQQNGGRPLDANAKQQIFESVYGVKAERASAPKFAKDAIAGTDIPEGAADIHGQPIDKAKHYREVWNNSGFVGYQQAAPPKASPQQEKEAQKVKEFQAVNPPREGETAEDYQVRSTKAVRTMQFRADAQRLINLGLTGQKSKLSVEQLQRDLQNGLTYRSAKVIWDGAWRAAGLRKRNDMDAFTKGTDELVQEELAKLGTSWNEVVSALKTQGTMPAEGTQTSTKKQPAAKSGGALPPGWEKK